ncbi:CBS domain-containing protein [Dictyoglomus thermophilum]|uniref:CBS domain-containing protein n=1 Tax=Dictyoglomus thermophilum TaxID=14 RepID=A0A7V3ZI03_DICTH|nr:CBS domain-containing protein [Dictyoglomus thermophilum]TYT22672.1 CBS domain-containing protein [Dictyoglomus thermophilum]
MEKVPIILTHNYLDFDALSSLYAAKKLYPKAIAYAGKSMERKVYEFYLLYKDILRFVENPDINVEIEKIILVDNHWLNRVEKKFQDIIKEKKVPIEIYDHHETGDIKGDIEFIEKTGSTTTILVEKLIEKKIPIDPIEATIFLLGMYQDTGNFLFLNTTPKDLKIASYLLERGADLNIINRYIYEKLTDEQKELLNELLQASKEISISGYRIVIASLEKDKYVEGLSILAHKVLDEKEADILFILLQVKDKIFVMGRSKTPNVDLREVLRDFNPGGHKTATTIVLNSQEIGLNSAEDLVIERLKKYLPRDFLAKDIMSYPVVTIPPDISIKEAFKIMMKYGYGGLCVEENKKLVGIISRRDIERAINLKLTKRKVKSFMSKPVITVTPETPIWEIEKILVEKNIGRVPVLDGDKIVGIITRQDILRFRFLRSNIYSPLGSIFQISEDKIRSSPWRDILEELRKITSQYNISIYAIGGFVRDLLLGQSNFDLDIVVEGDIQLIISKIMDKWEGKVITHPQFGTSEIILSDGKRIDIATARIEHYEEPGSLPKVERSSLWLDLKRRDFTINALAMSLNEENFGEIIDLYGGLEDLTRKELRILHNLSFVEDPTRILRGIRLEARLGFTFEEKTFKLLKEAIENGFLNKIAKERLKDEIILILQESQPEKVLKRLEELNALSYIFPIRKLPKNFEKKNQILKNEYPQKYELQILNIISEATLDEGKKWLQDLKFPQKIAYQFILLKHYQNISTLSEKDIINLSDLPDDFLLLLSLNSKKTGKDILRIRLLKEKGVPYLKGKDLLNMGFKGKIIGELLKQLFLKHYYGEVKTREEEEKFIKELINSNLK